MAKGKNNDEVATLCWKNTSACTVCVSCSSSLHCALCLCVCPSVCCPEEHEELKRLHSSKSEEQEGVLVSLKAQLKTTRAEIDQARRTLEGVDGHGQHCTSDKHHREHL